MKHLVLGSEGQIGKYVCDEIEKNGDEVTRWDVTLNPELMDLTNEGLGDLHQEMCSADFIHFLAYNVGGSKYLAAKQNSFEYIQSNIDIMTNVFKLLKETGKPFYFASSQMSNMTDSVYGQLKAVGESYTRALGGINVKFWNVFGYESDPEKSHVITDFIKMRLTEGRILCRTNGEERRHFTYAPDAARMLYQITQKYDEYLDQMKKHWGGKLDSLHIADPRATFVSMRSLAKFIDDAATRYLNDGKIPDPWNPNRYGNLYFSNNEDRIQTTSNVPDIKAVYLLDIPQESFIKLEDGLKEMVERIAKDYT